MKDVKSHHEAVGLLYENENLSEKDQDLVHKYSRNYRLTMLAIRVISITQAFSIYTKHYAGQLTRFKEARAVASVIGFLFVGDSLNYRWFYNRTNPIIEKYNTAEYQKKI